MRTRATRLVGSEGELAECCGAVDAARAGDSGAVFVLGAPGVGKSRLIAEASRYAGSRGLTVLRGRARSLGPSTAFEPFTEALAALSRQGRLPGRAELGAYLPLLSRVLPDVEPNAQPPQTEDTSPGAIAEAVLRVLAHCGWRDGGCLLALEDLHLAGVETLGILDYLVDNLAGLPVAVVASARTGTGPVDDLVAGAVRRQTAELVTMRALNRSELGEFTESCLDVEPADGRPPAVDEDVLDLLWHISDGVPLVVEQTLFAMVEAGQLQRREDRWYRVALSAEAGPGTLTQNLASRLQHLGPHGRDVVLSAAVLGERFPVELLQQVLGITGAEVRHAVRAAVSAQLLAPEEAMDWYALAHPLLGEAVLTLGDPVDRVRRADALADGILGRWPELPGSWCATAATLREVAGRAEQAALLRVQCARRAAAGGSATAAVQQAQHALDLFASLTHRSAQIADEVSGAVVVLIEALISGGSLDRALALLGPARRTTHSVDPHSVDPHSVDPHSVDPHSVDPHSVDPHSVDSSAVGSHVDDEPVRGHVAELGSGGRAELHLRLAWAMYLMGRTSEAADQLAAADILLGPHADEPERAAHDAILANVIVDGAHDSVQRLQRAEQIARRALEVAQRGLGASPHRQDAETACRAWNAIGLVSRERDLHAAASCFHQIVSLADEHGLPHWRVQGLVGAAGNSWLQDGGRAGFDVARAEADRVGAVALSLTMDASLVLHGVLTGQFSTVERDRQTCLVEARRLRSAALVRYLLATDVVQCAHLARREALGAALDRFEAAGGRGSVERPLVLGLGVAVGALLSGDPAGARRELDTVEHIERRSQSTFQLSGTSGLRLLLMVLDGSAPPDVERELTGVPAGMRWNRQFAQAARAVLAGRAGDVAAAARAWEVAQQAGQIYPLGTHLVRWLVSGEAGQAGWGEPQTWLREAETWFFDHAIAVAAADCRNQLRVLGARVGQRRAGTDQVPRALRELAVTVREYEVLQLAVERLGNRAIAERLHISPRTAEKHVASVVSKLAVRDREELILRGRALLDEQ